MTGLIVIDESGDLGSSGTKYFSVAALIVLRPRYLKKAADLFMEKNKDRDDFEDGKIGCQIHVYKDRFGGDTLLNSDLTKDMYFTESIDYYRLTNLINLQILPIF